MNEHAYYERSFDETSSGLFQKEWVVVFILGLAVLCISKTLHTSYKGYKKRNDLLPEHMV